MRAPSGRLTRTRVQYYAFFVHKIPVGVLGASGYAGRELCALIAGHPGLDLAFATANERRGDRLALAGGSVTFVAHRRRPARQGGAGVQRAARTARRPNGWLAFAPPGARVVDLSLDLRPGTRRRSCRTDSPSSNRARISGAPLIANPGCYPTAILLALAPLLRSAVSSLPGATVVANAASGVTGAGNSPRAELLFGEVTENYPRVRRRQHASPPHGDARDAFATEAATSICCSRRICCPSRAASCRRSRSRSRNP